MTKYNTNLNVNYCSSWGFWESTREILQNGLDQFSINPENELHIHYDEDEQELLISNKNSILERSTILMGCSSKSDDPNTIGQHGEGYKVALVVLTRLGKKVKIKNYKKNEIWTPFLEQEKSYNNEFVLKINVKKYIWKKVPDHNLTWSISNVTKEDWNDLRSKYLYLNDIKNYFCSKSNDNNVVIFDEKQKGMVYVNGLFVEKIKDLEFGYNLTPKCISLDRDRKRLDNFEIRFLTSNILSDYASQSEENSKIILKAIKKDVPDVSFLSPTSYSKNEDKIVQLIQSDFKKEHGNFAYPVSDNAELEKLSKISSTIKPILVNSKEKEFLKKSEDFESLEKFSKQFKGKNDNELSPYEILNMFLIENSRELNYNISKKFEELIEKSKNWKQKDSPYLKEELSEDEKKSVHIQNINTKNELDENIYKFSNKNNSSNNAMELLFENNFNIFQENIPFTPSLEDKKEYIFDDLDDLPF